ncbi:unnamed protein product, partial [Pylaiella littoralis]
LLFRPPCLSACSSVFLSLVVRPLVFSCCRPCPVCLLAVWQFCFIRSPVNYQVAGSCWSASSPSGLSLPPALGRHVVAAACSVLLPHRVACSPFSVVTARRCML